MKHKNSTTTIYNHLNSAFWTERQCWQCQTPFTPEDYQQHNYQLYFTRVIKVDQYHLETIIQLAHKKCCLTCNFSLSRDIYQKPVK